MSMEISQRDKKLLVYLFAIAVIAGTYFFVAKPFMDKTESLNTEITSLQNDVNHLTDVYINRNSYESRIVAAQTEYNETVNKFFGGLNQENTIMMVKGLEDDTKIWMSRVSFPETEIVIGGAPSEEGDEATNTGAISGMKQSLSIDYSVSYSDFKRFIDYVQNFDKRLFISNLSASYSVDADRVAGNLTMSQYALTGTGEEYKAPEINNVPLGVENIFTTLRDVSEHEDENGIEIKTLTNPAAGDGEESEQAEGEDGEESEEGEASEDESEASDSEEENQ